MWNLVYNGILLDGQFPLVQPPNPLKKEKKKKLWILMLTILYFRLLRVRYGKNRHFLNSWHPILQKPYLPP